VNHREIKRAKRAAKKEKGNLHYHRRKIQERGIDPKAAALHRKEQRETKMTHQKVLRRRKPQREIRRLRDRLRPRGRRMTRIPHPRMQAARKKILRVLK